MKKVQNHGVRPSIVGINKMKKQKVQFRKMSNLDYIAILSVLAILLVGAIK